MLDELVPCVWLVVIAVHPHPQLVLLLLLLLPLGELCATAQAEMLQLRACHPTASAAAAQRAERLDREGRGVLQRQGCEGGGSAEELDDIVVVETVAAVQLERGEVWTGGAESSGGLGWLCEW